MTPEEKEKAVELTYEMENSLRNLRFIWGSFPINIDDGMYQAIVSQMEHIMFLIMTVRSNLRKLK